MRLTKRRLLACLAIIAAIGLAASLFRKNSPPFPFEISAGHYEWYVHSNSHVYDFDATVSAQDMLECPKWDFRDPNPPVSAGEAIKAAQKYRDEIVDRGEFRPYSRAVELRLRPCDSESGDWFWTVKFNLEQAGQPVEHIEIAVLMNGKVVPLEVKRRIDVGWPLPDELPPRHETLLRDDQIVSEFVANLEGDRRFAGQEVQITGTIQRIPDEHEHLKSGQYLHFVTSAGEKLIFVKYGRPGPMDRQITIGGVLIGFRDKSEYSESWDNVRLYPGIRMTSMK